VCHAGSGILARRHSAKLPRNCGVHIARLEFPPVLKPSVIVVNLHQHCNHSLWLKLRSGVFAQADLVRLAAIFCQLPVCRRRFDLLQDSDVPITG